MNKRVVLILFIMFSAAIAYASVLKPTPEKEIHLPPNAYGLPLSKLWNMTLEITGVENSTAALDWLLIKLAEDGSLDHIVLEFYGMENGRPKMYHVEVNSRGKVTFYEGDVERGLGGQHPLKVLREIEKLDFRDLEFGEDGLVVDVDTVAGSLEYGSNLKLYLLKNGTLTPLKRIRFKSSVPWHVIGICKRKIMKSRSGSAESTVTVTITETSMTGQCFVVFMPQDLDKAVEVEYPAQT